MMISIIIPVYNAENYLAECLESVIEQDIVDKEIICVDDGSTDNSCKIIKNYQINYPYIKLINQTNMGAGIARNRAIDIALGKYVAFIDADDFYIDKTALRKMVCACEENDAYICAGFRCSLKNNGIKPEHTYSYRNIAKNEAVKLRFTDIQYDFYYQSYIYEKNFLDNNKIRFPDLRRYQDPPFFITAMWYAKEFIVIPVELYCYRVRTGIINYSFIQINDMLKGLYYNIEFAHENNLNVVYQNSIKRLNTIFYDRIYTSIKKGNILAIKLLIEIQEKAKEELLLLKTLENELCFLDNYNCDYIFPFDKVPYKSDVILYGAGKVGRYLYQLMRKMQYCNVCKWVDKEYDNYQKNGLKVSSPDEINGMAVKYIIIAVEKEELFDEIKKIIYENNQENERTIIGPIRRVLNGQ